VITAPIVAYEGLTDVRRAQRLANESLVTKVVWRRRLGVHNILVAHGEQTWCLCKVSWFNIKATLEKKVTTYVTILLLC